MKPSQSWPSQSLKNEAQIKAELRKMNDKQWLRMILTFQEPVRTRLANLIWWDFYSERLSAKRWGNLDLYLNAPHQHADEEDMKKALIYCGYSEQMATKRVNPDIDLPERRPNAIKW